ncbi:MAG: L-aspartate oxidase [Bacteroidetes bacterium]|nr:L-aspartate oxidase [Bacteroidota bacterium]MCH8522958.1 L-aspartate oxidase [Balneolales bacterium]
MSLKFDFLVVGSGSAGLTYALRVAEHGTVGIITKKDRAESNTNYAQGGIATVLDSSDSFESHIQDTLVAGAGLCKTDAVEIIVKEGPDVVHDLIAKGASFTRSEKGLDLGREGGHSANRIVHAADMTGREIERVLLKQVAQHPQITVLEHHFAMELLTEHHLGKLVTRYDNDTHCYGVYALNVLEDRVEKIYAKTTLLATGGAGRVYLHTTNPDIATGDGIAMAYRAKARVANMEFIQFHPTSLAIKEADSFLISEAVRGHGAYLRNSDGERFMHLYDERLELAPRDIVARAIDDQLKKRGDTHVYLDITHIPKTDIIKHFPNIYNECLKHGIDLATNWAPVVPAAHYICGGVVTDFYGRTSIHGLFAAGEVSCTGVHGANRLASNSLLEALVFAKRAALKAVEYTQKVALEHKKFPDWDDSGTINTDEWVLVSHNLLELQQLMADYVGIVRSDLRLERAFRRTKLLYEEVESFYSRNKVSVPLCQLRNIICTAYLIIRCAMKRKESRGLHYTTDYPQTDPNQAKDTVV